MLTPVILSASETSFVIKRYTNLRLYLDLYPCSVFYTVRRRSWIRCNGEDDSPGKNGLRHLHLVRQLLDPVRRRAVVRQLGQPAAARSPVHVHAGAPARQSQLRHLQPQQPGLSRRLPASGDKPDDLLSPSGSEKRRFPRQRLQLPSGSSYRYERKSHWLESQENDRYCRMFSDGRAPGMTTWSPLGQQLLSHPVYGPMSVCNKPMLSKRWNESSWFWAKRYLGLILRCVIMEFEYLLKWRHFHLKLLFSSLNFGLLSRHFEGLRCSKLMTSSSRGSLLFVDNTMALTQSTSRFVCESWRFFGVRTIHRRTFHRRTIHRGLFTGRLFTGRTVHRIWQTVGIAFTRSSTFRLSQDELLHRSGWKFARSVMKLWIFLEHVCLIRRTSSVILTNEKLSCFSEWFSPTPTAVGGGVKF